MNHKGSMQLPPKMAKQYADLARQGKYTKKIGLSESMADYEFEVGRQRIVLVSLDPPAGYVERL